MEYDIIATLGPASAEEATWKAMLAAGATGFRLNTSHLSLPELENWLERLQPFLAEHAPNAPLVLDLQGSKWRLGQFTPFELSAGEVVELVYTTTATQPLTLPVPHRDFFQAAPLASAEIVLDDARIRLRMETASPERLQARVIQGGPIVPGKGVTFTAGSFRRESLNEKDASILAQAILAETRPPGLVRYALSYVRDAAEMARYRAWIGPSAYLIAKIEREPAVTEAEQIASAADELWLCRGDLGAELGLAAMAEATHRFSRLPARLSIPVLMAGQVLEHMTALPTPTRSEVCYLYDALRQGYRGFVLSDETALGQFPVESCRAAALFRTGPID